MAIGRTQRDGKECIDVRYYILSRFVSAVRFASAVRGHWGIENRLHWQLDVTFQEDQCRIRKGTRGRELQQPASHGVESAEKRTDGEGRGEEQAADGGLGRDLPRESPVRLMS